MASSSPSSATAYQVFLSFRGDDTRRTFLSHLFKELTRLSIRTFKDDKDLNKGRAISSELHSAIKQSRIAIVVFSKNYAFSSWCLEELVTIFECSKMGGLKVIPVFYEVDPSAVRKQEGSFREALVKHEENVGKDKMHIWKEALTKVAENGGWDSQMWNDDAELISSIVRHVSDRLFPMSSIDNDGLVGMDYHMKELDHLFCPKYWGVRMIGIWGMGGIGKTTIARCFYDHVRRDFEHCCFIDNVKEMSKKHEAVKLQEQFLSELFREKNLKLWDAGSDAIKDRLCCKKVLVVLDDVDELDQLQVFAKELEWFGPGSRVIITTRDVGLLESHKVQGTYKVELLRDIEALELFSKYAIERDCPREDFWKLTKEVIKYANGLPLALRVLGLMLRNRTRSDWEDALKRLSITPNRSISKVLRLSFDGLYKDEKDIFLYIACAFNWYRKENISTILKGCGFNTKLGIKSLIEKSLIICDDESYIQVHDLLQDMARDIIREDCPGEPWRYKIVWDTEDIDQLFTVSSQYDEMIRAEGIFANMSRATELYLSPMAFRRMYNLKLLKISHNYNAGERKVQLPGGLDYLPKKLVYLFWDAFPLKSLPSGFHAEKLVELHLPNSSVEKLWRGTQPLWNLKAMNLKGCMKLIEVPDLSKATGLESLNLFHCESLEEVPSSVGNLQNLRQLKLSKCKRLKKLPSGINLKSLTSFHPYKCSSLSEFPCISHNLRLLSVIRTAIEEVPPLIKHLSRLESLNMSHCKKLKILPSEIQNLDLLHTLDLSHCPSITKFPEVGKSIRWLYLRATAIESVPIWIKNKSGLWVLDMSYCKRLKNLPITIQSLTSLQNLDLEGCSNINEFPEIPRSLIFLSLQGTKIQNIYHEAIRRRGNDSVITGEYDANGRWTPARDINCSHQGLVLASQYDYFRACPSRVRMRSRVLSLYTGEMGALLGRRLASYEI